MIVRLSAAALVITALLVNGSAANAQDSRGSATARSDTAQRLGTLRVIATTVPRTITYLPDHYGALLLTGK